MRERFGAKNPRSWWMRFHSQTAGCSLTAQQPEINIVRTTIQALAAVLGGTQSLHTNSLDETLALPTEQAARIALRTQQIIAHESGVTNTLDPLGGSYFIEELTNRMEQGCFDYFDKIDQFGGLVEAIEAGFPQREIWDAAYQYQRSVDSGEKTIVGVNAFQMEKGCFEYIEKIDQFGGMVEAIEAGFPQREIWDASYQFQRAVDSAEKIVVGVNAFRMEQEDPHDILYIDESVTEQQMLLLNKVRAERDPQKVQDALQALRTAAADPSANTMPPIIEAVKVYATVGEISDALRYVFGTYQEQALF